MFRPRLFALFVVIVPFALGGCDFGADRARMEAEAARRVAEEDRLRAHEAQRQAEAEREALLRENAKLRAELEETNKLLGRDVTQPAPKK